MRFSILQIKDGPWIIVDRLDHRRRIASCIDSGAAQMIAALMNGNVEQASKRSAHWMVQPERWSVGPR